MSVQKPVETMEEYIEVLKTDLAMLAAVSMMFESFTKTSAVNDPEKVVAVLDLANKAIDRIGSEFHGLIKLLEAAEEFCKEEDEKGVNYNAM